jgi:hypothetical protein
MSVRTSGTRLAMLTKEITTKWKETREFWKDTKSAEFEARFMDELQGSVDNAVTVIDKLDKLISKIRKDCE